MSGSPARALAPCEYARDRALLDVGIVIIGLQDDGRGDAEIIDAVMSMIELRMRMRRIDPVEALTGGPM